MTEIDGASDRSGISTNRNVANLSTYREMSPIAKKPFPKGM